MLFFGSSWFYSRTTISKGIVKLSCICVAIQEACSALLMRESSFTESPVLQI